jgi:hypothetical protein
VLQSDDFGRIADANSRFWGLLGDAYGHSIPGGLYGGLKTKDGKHFWAIINGHFYKWY